MNDSKFCEHGVNVGLKNPPVFCGQCPPDTIATLRADLATETAAHEDRCREVAALRADLARVTGERDEARAKVAGLALSVGTVKHAVACIAHSSDCLGRDDGDDAALAELNRYAEVLGGGR